MAPENAYRLWSESYDAQPDFVIFALEQEIFGSLLSDAPIGQIVVDIGCGTGRHWGQLLSSRPGRLHGVDSSPEMLARLRARYPDATLHRRIARRMAEFSDASVDLVVSTLMLGHVREVEGELREWTRLLKTGGKIIVTDFHPEASRAGMKRTFTHRGSIFEVVHYPRTVKRLRCLFRKLRLDVERFEERTIEQTVRHGVRIPLVLGFRLRKVE